MVPIFIGSKSEKVLQAEFTPAVVVIVVCVLAPAYTSLFKGLEYLPKVRYMIVIDPL